ncbi:protein phosphatase [Streptomyces sp. NRRL F-5122]|uniref:ATP-binding SpoIIE family protein phosphatase n=2 Tax=unclassified Streptomyces TaxID=2593676 RepID=UPI000740F550|nr:SpoIIE family protein phosphatase [Streptomyces sp. NRRL F-5122]KUJ42461.1 protein phosphatase [Streptomyces sp. NRRL F-5122]
MGSSTERARSEAQKTLEAVGAALAVLDAEGTVVGWSQAAQRLVGHSAAEVVGQSAAALLAAEEDRARAATVAARSGPWGRWSCTARVLHRDGHEVDVGLCVQSLAGRDGRAQWVVTASDPAPLPSWTAEDSVGTESPLAASGAPQRPPIGVEIRDTRLRCIWVNGVQGAQAETLEGVMHQLLDNGGLLIDPDQRALLQPDARQDSTSTAPFFRLDDAWGRALGVCAVNPGTTDARRAREHRALLDEAGKRIGTSLDVMRTGQELADLAVPFLADYATVDLADPVLLGEDPPTRPGPGKRRHALFRRAGLASIHPGAPESLFARGEPVLVPPTSPYTTVLSGGSHLYPVVDSSSEAWLDQDPLRARRMSETGMHSLMIVPIHARGSVLGMAAFMRTQDPRPFEEDDLLLAEELVGRAALSLDNARQYARERSAALALQRHLLPHRVTGEPAADVAWRYLPADSHHGVGGDWFDVIPLSGARTALVVGDVLGHGINAAATMGQLRTAVRTLADMDLPPEDLLAHLDEQVVRLAEKDVEQGDPAAATIGATCLYAVYDPATGQCTMARAGHPPPAIIDPHGQVTFPELPVGPPLGLGLAPFESVTLELSGNSVLALYTDGLIESRDQDIDAGIDRLAAALAHPGLDLEDLCSRVVDALPAQAPIDDATLLLARTRSLGPSRTVSWEFAADPAVVGHARALTTRQLARWQLEHLADSTELIVSELITNAIRHGSGPVRLRLIRHRFLTCEVYDTSCSSPRLHHPRTTDVNGRGLFLVAQLSRKWGTRHTPDGKLIWAEQQLTPRCIDP